MKVSIIGSGNVATHLARAIDDAGHTIECICSRNIGHACELAKDIQGASATDDPECIPQGDIIIIAVSDSAIEAVSKAIGRRNEIVIHTSGATPMDVLLQEKRGVIYPCQTFTKSDEIDMRKVPLLIEGNDDATLKEIVAFAKTLSRNVSLASSEQRKHLHIAAVMACNFTNHLLLLAKREMENNGMEMETLRPLVEQTISKAFAMDPYEAQTGPARRNDTLTIESHRKLITDPATRDIYDLLTNSIKNNYIEK